MEFSKNKVTHKREMQEDQPLSSGKTSSSSAQADMTLTHDPYQALRFRDFRLLLLGNFIASLGSEMVTVALGWELYERTSSALVLGMVGLVQILPMIALSLFAGHIADRFNRKRILLIAQMLMVLCSLGLTWLSYTHGLLLFIYGCLFIMGAARAFKGPASVALLAQTIPEEAYSNAATWDSSSWQMASVLGPALGGTIIAVLHGSTPVYALNAGFALLFVLLLLPIRVGQAKPQTTETTTLGALGEGLHFLWQTKIILAAITLDLFAVLLGGAATLLPIFARDILHVGPAGLGWLRAAPSIGAICVIFFLAHRPPFKKAGRALLWTVAGFGIATLIFGLSRSFWLSLLALLLLGGLDSISVVIRGTLLLTRTPDAMRGRIAAVDSLFTSASNELGGFESGLIAQLFGPIISVVSGGIGTILVVLLVALLLPELRRLGALNDSEKAGV
ncbi:MAG TPA: MFS transporter [Ktedonosporobacter sp.]|nr:MFS transporter [Ktedonosporobacter sp.]